MFFWHFFAGKPFAALSVLICLSTIYSCITLKKGYIIHASDKFLIAFVGLMAIYQGLRIVREVGFLTLPINSVVADLVDLLIAAILFQAPMMLRLSCDDRLTADHELRLAKAAPHKGRPNVQLGPRQSNPVPAQTLLWGLETLSDTAFKLYIYFWLHSDSLTKTSRINSEEVCKALGWTAKQLDIYIGELRQSGGCPIRREGSVLQVELVSRETTVSLDNMLKSLRTSIEPLGESSPSSADGADHVENRC